MTVHGHGVASFVLPVGTSIPSNTSEDVFRRNVWYRLKKRRGQPPAKALEDAIEAERAWQMLRLRPPTRAAKEKPETMLQRQIMERLETMPHVKVERNNRGARGHVRFGLGDGAADLVGVVRCSIGDSDRVRFETGRFFALEIKLPGEKPDPHQEAWAESVRALGGYVGCAHSVEEALKCVAEARYE